MSERGDADCAFEMRNGVKIPEGRDMENQNISDDLGVKSMIQFVVCKIYILHIIFRVIIYGFFFS